MLGKSNAARPSRFVVKSGLTVTAYAPYLLIAERWSRREFSQLIAALTRSRLKATLIVYAPSSRGSDPSKGPLSRPLVAVVLKRSLWRVVPERYLLPKLSSALLEDESKLKAAAACVPAKVEPLPEPLASLMVALAG